MSFLAANLSHWTLAADTRTMQRQVVEKDMKRLSLSHLTFWISRPPKIRPVFRGNTVNYHMFNRAGIEFAYLCVMCNFWNEHALQCTSDWNRIPTQQCEVEECQCLWHRPRGPKLCPCAEEDGDELIPIGLHRPHEPGNEIWFDQQTATYRPSWHAWFPDMTYVYIWLYMCIDIVIYVCMYTSVIYIYIYICMSVYN